MKGRNPSIPWEEVEVWLTVAERDRRSILLCLDADPPLPEIAAFHCQQAAEKLLKGFLVLAGAGFRRTHELAELGAAAAKSFPEIAALVETVESWTVWGVAYRYPSAEGPLETGPDQAELREAVAAIDELAARLRIKRPPD